MKLRLDQHVCKTHTSSETGNTPLEDSQYERGVALWRAHFFQADPGEREWIEERRGQGGSLEVELSDTRTRTANVSGASNAFQTNNTFKVLTTLRGAAESNTSKGFTEYFLFKVDISTTKEVFPV
ncbi:hypothetical protein CesoFtcFv8_025913 [Champsocephalus esox]|uniref:Uncharacterized protein n=1 Tax=Champsocephalus esox TaxID=159716 RepID=A0AAN8G8H2_9TELE|nr:hypothetical protein CesoFtcFv8_025913 [Champsocephalus esox]